MLRMNAASEEERLLEPVEDDAGEVADKRYPCHILHIPAERDVLQAHHYDTGSRTDDKHRAADTGTVGK